MSTQFCPPLPHENAQRSAQVDRAFDPELDRARQPATLPLAPREYSWRRTAREDPSVVTVDVKGVGQPTKFVRSTSGCSACQLVRLALAQYGTTDGRVLLTRALEVLESDHG